MRPKSDPKWVESPLLGQGQSRTSFIFRYQHIYQIHSATGLVVQYFITVVFPKRMTVAQGQASSEP